MVNGRASTLCFFEPHDFLAKLGQDDLTELKRLAKSRSVSKQRYIFREGDADTDVYVIERGRVNIYQSSSQGKDILLWFLMGGDIFAVNKLYPRLANTGYGSQCSALASEDSDILAVPQEAFKAYLTARPRVGEAVLEICLHRLDCLRNRLVNLAVDDVEQRLRKLLDSLCQYYGVNQNNGRTQISIPLTHQEIASIIGTSRQTASALLTKLKSQGLLDIDKRNLVINTDNQSGFVPAVRTAL